MYRNMLLFFFFNDTATTEIYTLSLHDALPISEAIVEAMKKTNVKDILAVAAGPVVFNEIGDNPNASTAMIQILGQKPVVVWPRDAAVQKVVFPRPKV